VTARQVRALLLGIVGLALIILSLAKGAGARTVNEIPWHLIEFWIGVLGWLSTWLAEFFPNGRKKEVPNGAPVPPADPAPGPRL
jgi:hypothetical protein